MLIKQSGPSDNMCRTDIDSTYQKVSCSPHILQWFVQLQLIKVDLFSLDKNNIGDAEVKDLAEALRVNTTLRKLE